MSDLGAIFHVKKSGTQYDAHAYTTTDECPYPNIKINFKGQQGYVKLEDKGSGDVPCYVKPKSEDKIYQVRKEAIPTGKIVIEGNITFTVPAGIKVIKVTSPTHDLRTITYVGVTPNSVHALKWKVTVGNNATFYNLHCNSHHSTLWGGNEDYDTSAELSWSPEINNHAVNYKDY